MTATRNRRRSLQGVVSSSAADKTITVVVERTFRHPRYGKFVRRRKKYMAHDEQNEARVGDRVEIVATRPLSKRKRWRLARVLTQTVFGDSAPVRAEETEARSLEIVGADEPKGSGDSEQGGAS